METTATAKELSMNRTFDAARKAQGFKSQEHLDAFFASFDHSQACADCNKAGESVFIDDGFQPTKQNCPEAGRLLAASWAY